MDETSAAEQEKMSRYELIPDCTPSPEEIYMERVRETELLDRLKKHITEMERKAVLGLMNGWLIKK